jgi:hypothetical protein
MGRIGITTLGDRVCLVRMRIQENSVLKGIYIITSALKLCIDFRYNRDSVMVIHDQSSSSQSLALSSISRFCGGA